MLSVALGLPIGFLGFVLATSFSNRFIGSGLPLLIGISAGWLIWRYFKMLDDNRLNELLISGEQVFTVPLPLAWGVVKEVLNGSLLVSGAGRITRWMIDKEDQGQGVLVSVLAFRETKEDSSNVTADNTIRVTASLKHHHLGTQAAFRYEILTGSHNAAIERIIQSTNAEIANELELRSAAFE
ncbi:MAG: hypothetical protein K2Z81_12475 [Cyanobacteria bacterium]|nr:hypothetical protein [Cyanobacteriota bacterium]